eukprot:scaffold238666_cov31-Tisochrysis_lutea.AAC.3
MSLSPPSSPKPKPAFLRADGLRASFRRRIRSCSNRRACRRLDSLLLLNAQCPQYQWVIPIRDVCDSGVPRAVATPFIASN